MRVADFLAWALAHRGDGRFELVDGKIVAMAGDRVRHNRAKKRAANELDRAISAAGVGCETFIDGVGVATDDFSVRLPDVVMHCGEIDPEAMLADNPVILVEVVSPTSEERDVTTKLREYFSIPSVQHYLIIYDQRRYVIHYRRLDGDRLETSFVTSGELRLDPPGLQLAVAALFPEIAA
jgi:Uma2 family endonuclease